jgi:integrase
VEPRTYERYSDLLLKNLTPVLGGILLVRLQPIQISKAYIQLIESGRRDGKGGLSPRTVHHAHRVLFSALEQAERWKMIARNPAALLEKKDRPKVLRKTVAIINPDATAAAIEGARSERLLIPILLGSMCGARRGEIAAARWRSCSLDQAMLAIIASTEQTDAGTIREKPAKSDKARTVALPSLVVDELRRWRVEQAQELLQLGVRATDETHILTEPDGSPVRPRTLTKRVSAFLKANGHSVTLHGLRHSHASHLLASKIHPKVVQERLGHSSIAITMDVYSHLMPNIQEGAAAEVDDVLRAAINRRAKDVG